MVSPTATTSTKDRSHLLPTSFSSSLAALDSSGSSELSKEQKCRKAKALKKNTSPRCPPVPPLQALGDPVACWGCLGLPRKLFQSDHVLQDLRSVVKSSSGMSKINYHGKIMLT